MFRKIIKVLFVAIILSTCAVAVSHFTGISLHVAGGIACGMMFGFGVSKKL